jgi:NAD(P)H-hydrate epimerase
MPRSSFRTPDGRDVPAVTAAEMQDVDRVVVVAGDGGNGGGGMACARHLANRDVPVRVLLDRAPEELTGAAAHQDRILETMAVPRTTDPDRPFEGEGPLLVVDALIGYGLSGEVRAPAGDYIDRMNHRPDPVVVLDVPSGRDATTGKTRGAVVTPDRTVTLALPKTGLDGATGTLYLTDIGIPGTVYDRLGIDYDSPFGDHDWVELEVSDRVAFLHTQDGYLP